MMRSDRDFSDSLRNLESLVDNFQGDKTHLKQQLAQEAAIQTTKLNQMTERIKQLESILVNQQAAMSQKEDS